MIIVPNKQATPAKKEAFVAREGIITGEMVTLTPEQAEARKKRSRWIALALFGFVILIFVITLTKMGGGALQGAIEGGL